MKRIISFLILCSVLLCFAGCDGKRGVGGTATPGDLVTSTPHPIHVGEELTDVSASYEARLCTYPWLETEDMSYIQLDADGSFRQFDDEGLSEETGSGTWVLYKDADGYLSLRIQKDGAEPYVMYDLELYEQSIFAYGEDGATYIWLMCDPD